MPKILKRSSSAKKPADSLSLVRSSLKKLDELKVLASEAGNATNRQKTVVKNAIFKALEEKGGTRNDGIILDGELLAFRSNETREINPRTWHEWFVTKRISENQYFAAISVSVSAAAKAIGEDQIPDVSVETLTKTADLRRDKFVPGDTTVNDGDIIPFKANLPTAKEIRAKVPTPADTPIKVKAKRRIRIRS